MWVLKGTMRRVFVLKNIAIKTPLNFKGYLANINEIHNWYKYKLYREHLCPIIFHDLLGFVVIMKRVQPVYDLDEYDISFMDYTIPVFNDIKTNNFGLLDNKLVKIDYGNDYWLYNVWVDIKNKLKKYKLRRCIKMTRSKNRGNEIYFNENDKTWYYADTNLSVPDTYKIRPCGNCGRSYTEVGHDGCLGTLIGLMNACCGHGNVDESYVQFWDGEVVSGKDAKIIQDILKKYKKERTKEDDKERLEYLKGYVKELEKETY